MLFVRLRRLLGLKVVIYFFFVEYYSKRNFVERVYAVYIKEFEKYGLFQIFNFNVDSVEYKKKMEEMREDVEDVFRQVKFGGEYITVIKGVGGENNFVFDDMFNFYVFLLMIEDRKVKCDMQY